MNSAVTPRTTRWWWVRHAPVRDDGGRIYGQSDLGCDCSDRVVFDSLARVLPRDAVWFSSTLKRTHQTAQAVWDAGFARPLQMKHEADFAEQHLGDWQGRDRAEFYASRPVVLGSHWFGPADEKTPGGESFVDLMERASEAIREINETHKGRDIVAVTHGGTIRAALALAMGLSADAAVRFEAENVSLTLIEHYEQADPAHAWRIVFTNLLPRLVAAA